MVCPTAGTAPKTSPPASGPQSVNGNYGVESDEGEHAVDDSDMVLVPVTQPRASGPTAADDEEVAGPSGIQHTPSPHPPTPGRELSPAYQPSDSD